MERVTRAVGNSIIFTHIAGCRSRLRLAIAMPAIVYAARHELYCVVLPCGQRVVLDLRYGGRYSQATSTTVAFDEFCVETI